MELALSLSGSGDFFGRVGLPLGMRTMRTQLFDDVVAADILVSVTRLRHNAGMLIVKFRAFLAPEKLLAHLAFLLQA